ncbi:phage head spike fiber domain-containing protein [Cypionkella sp. TWP1-2-1b2]|uniref:phage head spike fiber domain-containing protein n=1 Tax=Cypionkella sp. TWP1-2-1b2 TaxID=2804675 RepID=UPI003CEB411C
MRTDMEIGAQRSRRITFARNDVVDMSWVMEDAEFAAFRAWWNDEVWSIAGDSESLAAWTYLGAARTIGGALTPDGEIVDQVIEDAATSLHYTRLNLPDAADNQTLQLQVSLQAAGRQFARLAFYDRAAIQRYTDIDLINGVMSAQSGLASRLLENRGNGWWRLTIAAAVGSGGNVPNMRVFLMPTAATTNYAGDGISGLAISEIGVRTVTGFDLHLRTGTNGKALGAAGSTAWVQMPIAVGGGYKFVEARFKAPFKATAGAALNWNVSAQMEVRNA